MLLGKIASGTRVMIDSNTFLYARENPPVIGTECDAFLSRVARGDIEGFTTTSIVAEVTHRVMCAEAIRVHGLTPRTVVRALKSQPDLVKALTENLSVGENIVAMNIAVLPVTIDDVLASKAHRHTYGLLLNDSLTVALMEAHGILAIATSNGDFDRVSALQAYKPTP